MEQPARAQKMIGTYAGGLAYKDNDLQTKREEKETALVAYEQAIMLVPREGVFYYHKGHILEQLGREIEAQQAYEDAQRLGYQVPE